MGEEIKWEWPPFRTDSVCVGALQYASKAAVFKAAGMYPARCAMWAQLDEIGIRFRGILLSKPEFKEAKSEVVRWDDLHGAEMTLLFEKAISDALNRLAAQLVQ